MLKVAWTVTFSIGGASTLMREIMNEALTKKLLDDFPRLFRDRSATSMQRGFECGDGWFDMIYGIICDESCLYRLAVSSTKCKKCRVM